MANRNTPAIKTGHASIVTLCLCDNKLTHFHGGRFKQLSQFGGQVISEIVA